MGKVGGIFLVGGGVFLSRRGEGSFLKVSRGFLIAISMRGKRRFSEKNSSSPDDSGNLFL